MKSLLKRAAFSVAPQTMTALISARARAHSHKLVEEWGLADLNRRLIDTLGASVQSGPFAGMILSPMTWKEHLGPYLLGTYEAELHPWFAQVLGEPFDTVVDVGSKFGYYAVGVALKGRVRRVVAFDTDAWARRATREMARANGVDSVVDVQGYCTPSRLEAVLAKRSLVISDCEGYERVLFADQAPHALDGATLIVEIHEELSPGVERAIRSRFARSHSIEMVNSLQAVPRTAPQPTGALTAADIERALAEVRPPQQWLLAQPRAS